MFYGKCSKCSSKCRYDISCMDGYWCVFILCHEFNCCIFFQNPASICMICFECRFFHAKNTAQWFLLIRFHSPKKTISDHETKKSIKLTTNMFPPKIFGFEIFEPQKLGSLSSRGLWGQRTNSVKHFPVIARGMMSVTCLYSSSEPQTSEILRISGKSIAPMDMKQIPGYLEDHPNQQVVSNQHL